MGKTPCQILKLLKRGMVILMKESEFQAQVIALAKRLGWIVYHTHDSRRSEKGFPDLVLVRDRVLFRELKTDKGRLSPEQKFWGELLSKAGSDYAVWRPSDMQSIVDNLRK